MARKHVMHRTQVLFTSVALLVGAVSTSQVFARPSSPSFDCRKATTWAERTICADAELSSLDRDMANAYKLALQSGNAARIKAGQIKWIKDRENCFDASIGEEQCLKDIYNFRLDEINKLAYSPSRNSKPVRYAADQEPFSEAVNVVRDFYQAYLNNMGSSMKMEIGMTDGLRKLLDRVDAACANATDPCGLDADIYMGYMQDAYDTNYRRSGAVFTELPRNTIKVQLKNLDLVMFYKMKYEGSWLVDDIRYGSGADSFSLRKMASGY